VEGSLFGGFQQKGIAEHPLFHGNALPDACSDGIEWFHIV